MPTRRSSKRSPQKSRQGFTLAELLITLAILGIIAAFAIPKILDSTQSNKQNAITKEAAGLISAAYKNYRGTYTPMPTTNGDSLTQYMNYVNTDTSTVINNSPNNPVVSGATLTCGSNNLRCLRLHNGAILAYHTTDTFNGTALTNAIPFYLDPDGGNNGNDSVELFLYTNSRLSSGGTCQTNTTWSAGSQNPDTSYDPNWLSWTN